MYRDMQPSLWRRALLGDFYKARMHTDEQNLIFYQHRFASRLSFVMLSSDLLVFSHGKLIVFAEIYPLVGKTNFCQRVLRLNECFSIGNVALWGSQPPK